ncbi:hypothetical protein TcWFU_001645 [Taenia crassiceps]|uniref:Uncharacterized protein n=1 Tax=Taenia crassiceps TaxID=6207 RepID=A0ABR4QCS8_9CEST
MHYSRRNGFTATLAACVKEKWKLSQERTHTSHRANGRTYKRTYFTHSPNLKRATLRRKTLTQSTSKNKPRGGCAFKAYPTSRVANFVGDKFSIHWALRPSQNLDTGGDITQCCNCV